MTTSLKAAAPVPASTRWLPTLQRTLDKLAGPHIGALTSVAALIAAIHVSYEYLIAPSYAYMGLIYVTPQWGTYTTMIVLLLAMSLILPIRMSRPSDFILWGLFAIVVIPSLLITHLARTLPTVQQLTLGFTVTLCFSGAILVARLPPERLWTRLKPVSVRVFWIVVIAFSAVTYLTLAAGGNLRLALPGFGQIYAVRGSFAASNANALLPYLMPNQSTVINPLLMAVGLSAKRPIVFVAGIVGELLLYATAGHKSVLFAIPAILVIAWVFRGGRRPAGAVIAWGFTAVIAVSAIVDAVTRTPWLSSLFTRRFIDLPGLLTGAWIHVFSMGPKAHFGYSFLSRFLPYPYDVNPPFVVARDFFNQPTMNANANFIADGFANLGWLGIAFEAAVLAVVLALANAASRSMPVLPMMMLAVMPVVSLANASMITSLLSHGIILMIAVFAFSPREVWLPKTHAPTFASHDPVQSPKSPAPAPKQPSAPRRT